MCSMNAQFNHPKSFRFEAELFSETEKRLFDFNNVLISTVSLSFILFCSTELTCMSQSILLSERLLKTDAPKSPCM